MNTREKLHLRLVQEGLKLTKQRIAILDVFLQSKNRVLSAQEVFEKLLTTSVKINFSTVYRNLETFTHVGVLKKLDLGFGVRNYEVSLEGRHHHHLICKLCGQTKRIDFCPFEDYMHKISREDFEPVDHTFEIFGYCKKCQKEMRRLG